MPIKSASVVMHQLRWLLIASFLIALPTNIAAAASLHAPLLIFGLVPLGLSFLLAVCFMTMRYCSNSDNAIRIASRASTAAVAIAGDILCLTAMAAVLLLNWTYAKRHWYWDSGLFVLAAFAMAPLLCSVVVHAYLGLLMLSHYLAFHDRHTHAFILAPYAPEAWRHCNQSPRSTDRMYFSLRPGRHLELVKIRNEEQSRDTDKDVTVIDRKVKWLR